MRGGQRGRESAAAQQEGIRISTAMQCTSRSRSTEAPPSPLAPPSSLAFLSRPLPLLHSLSSPLPLLLGLHSLPHLPFPTPLLSPRRRRTFVPSRSVVAWPHPRRRRYCTPQPLACALALSRAASMSVPSTEQDGALRQSSAACASRGRLVERSVEERRERSLPLVAARAELEAAAQSLSLRRQQAQQARAREEKETRELRAAEEAGPHRCSAPAPLRAPPLLLSSPSPHRLPLAPLLSALPLCAQPCAAPPQPRR